MLAQRPKKNRIRVGDRFGRLTVRSDLGTERYGSNRVRRLACVCDCGTPVTAWASHLRSGGVQSCGCLQRDRKPQRSLGTEAAFRVVLRSYRANARKRDLPFALTEERVRQLIANSCSYCGCEPASIVQTRSGYGSLACNGIDRVNSEIGYVEGNVVACCSTCNTAKASMGVDAFLAWVKRVYDHSVAQKGDNTVRIVF